MHDNMMIADVGDIDEWLEGCERDVAAAASDERATRDSSGSYAEVAHETIQVLKERAQSGRDLAGQTTGLVDVDRLTGGLCDGDLVILAGRPGQGKTTIVQQFSEYAAERENRAWVIFSLEMPRGKLMERTIARRAHVDFQRVRVARLLPEDWRKIITSIQGEGGVASLPIVIDDDFGLTPRRMRAKVRAHLANLRKERNQPDLQLGGVVVDYIQLMSSDEPTENRNQDLSGISRDLKRTAKELGCPILALSQLNRPVKGQAVKAPQLFDLRDSGALEADADCVWFIHREDMYRAPGDPMTHKAQFIQAKGRNAGEGSCELYFDGEHSLFANISYDDGGGWASGL